MKTFVKFLAEIGRSKPTGWRWIKSGWIEPVNISGRLYITAEEEARFHARAAAGEFARETPVPINTGKKEREQVAA
jgi:hypothetical protein